jgi:hypothetical protein
MYWLTRLRLDGVDLTDPNVLMLVAGMTTGDVGSSFKLDRSGRLTDGTYTVNESQMMNHMPATAGPDKSVFLSGVDAHKAVLDAARFADRYNLWTEANKARVFVQNGPVGVHGQTGLLSSWINVYRRASGMIHGAPASPQE